MNAHARANHRESHHQQFGRDEARQFCRWLFGPTPNGYLAMAFKVAEDRIPHRTDRAHNDYALTVRSGDRYGWVERKFDAADLDDMLDEVAQRMTDDPVKVMISSALYEAPTTRTGDNIKRLRAVFLDYDGHGKSMTPELFEQLRRARPLLVWSGTPHNFHAYVFVRDLNREDHRRLIRALRDEFGGDSKISANDLLSLPGTYNLKNGRRVRLLSDEKPALSPSVDRVADVLGLDLDVVEAPSIAVGVPMGEPLDVTPARVRRTRRLALSGQDDDLSDANFRIVKTCKEQGLTPGQTFTFMREHLVPNVDYTDKDRGDSWLADDIGRIWGLPGKKAKPTRRTGGVRRASRDDAAPTEAMEPVRQTSWTLNDLMAAEFPDLWWAVDGFIPEGLTLVVAAPKIGKSFLTVALALAMCSGNKALDAFDVTPGEVLIIPLDDPSPRRMQDRIKKITVAMGGGVRFKHELYIETDWPTLAEGGGEQLDEWLTDHPDCRMVVIDTLSRLRDEESRKSTDPGKPDERAMAEFKAIADKHRVAIVGTHHDRKQGDSDDFVDMVAGNKKLTGGADTIIYLKRARGQGVTVAKITGRDVEERELALMFEFPVWIKLDETPAELAMSDTRYKIVEYLREVGEATIGDVAEALVLQRRFGVSWDADRRRAVMIAAWSILPGGSRRWTSWWS